MFDLFIGKPPTTNRQMDREPSSIPKVVRNLLRIARNIQRDRRKNTSERRYRANPDYIVELSNNRERRLSLDRRQKLDFLVADQKARERRQKRLDRRRSVIDGIIVTLSSMGDRRSATDRRRMSQGI